jgi:hypothetical protein
VRSFNNYSHIALTSFRTYVVWPQTQYIKPSAKIPKCDAEDVVFLNPHDQDLMLDHTVEIRKQIA